MVASVKRAVSSAVSKGFDVGEEIGTLQSFKHALLGLCAKSPDRIGPNTSETTLRAALENVGISASCCGLPSRNIELTQVESTY